MLVQSKVQIDKNDYEFIKQALKELQYKSISEYMREAIKEKIKEDRQKIREKKRNTAMEMIGKAPIENLFEAIEGDDFEAR